MRTRGVKERTVCRRKERMSVDIGRIWNFLSLIFGFNIRCSLFLGRKRRPLKLIRNMTALPFEHLSLYYPIASHQALYLGEPGEPMDIADRAMTVQIAAKLNPKIAQGSHTQIYEKAEVQNQKRTPLSAHK